MSDEHLSSLTFGSLPLTAPLAQGIVDAGFKFCTPIQAQTLPLALQGRDVAGQAQTGTGKTAAFLVALYQSLLTKPAAPNRARTSIRALIVAPTRELAVQIHKDAAVLGKHTGLKLAVVFGGTDYEKQRRTLAEGVDVLVGTPGRLIDYFKQQVFDLRHAQVLVLDEADRMFDLGFIADIRYLLRRLPRPEHRQSMLFSATLSHRVLELAYEHMNNPELVRIEPDKVTIDRIRQVIYFPVDGGEAAAADRTAARDRGASHAWCSSTRAARPSGSRPRCAPTASTRRRSRATCRRRSACSSCDSSTRASSRC